jgi:hypothetical protein
MQKLVACFFTLLLFMACPAYAHGPNGEPHLPDEKLIETAQLKFNTYVPNKELVKGEYLDESWYGTLASGIVKRDKAYVIVLFENKKNSRQLYMLLTSWGTYLDSNFTNWFAGIE